MNLNLVRVRVRVVDQERADVTDVRKILVNVKIRGSMTLHQNDPIDDVGISISTLG